MNTRCPLCQSNFKAGDLTVQTERVESVNADESGAVSVLFDIRSPRVHLRCKQVY